MEAEAASETLFLKKKIGRWISPKARFFEMQEVLVTQSRCSAVTSVRQQEIRNS
jgi:hypothetical protein